MPSASAAATVRRALRPMHALERSWDLFRARPGAALALGGAISVSFFAVCCGLGLFAAPWFLCELFSLQLRASGRDNHPRGRAWFAAGASQLAAVAALGSIGALTALGLGAHTLPMDALNGELEAMRLAPALALLAMGGAAATALAVHLVYAPAILIDRGGPLHGALLESARLVRGSGAWRTWRTSALSHALQLAPAMLGLAWIVQGGSPQTLPLIAVVGLPMLLVVIPLGQGMIVASYLHVAGDLVEPAAVPLEARPSRIGTVVWLGLLALVGTGPTLVAAAIVRPAPLSDRAVQAAGTPILDAAASPAGAYDLQDTGLTLHVSPETVRVVASDGGGAGTLPLRGAVLVERVRVSRQGPEYTIALQTDAGPRVTQVDGAGVRLDDGLLDRAGVLLPPWAQLLLALSLLWTSVWMARSLDGHARVRRRLTEADGRAPDSEELTALRSQIRQSALRAALWLAPAALASVCVGVLALGG